MMRFVEEARMTGHLEHRGGVPMHDLGYEPQPQPLVEIWSEYQR